VAETWRVVAVLHLFQELAVVVEEAVDAALLHQLLQKADGDVGLAHANRPNQQSPLPSVSTG
jgi:hypothetical protein